MYRAEPHRDQGNNGGVSTHPKSFSFALLRRALGVLACCLGMGNALAASGVAWLEDGRPVPQAWQALSLLEDAPSQGMDPADYPTVELRRAVEAAQEGQEPPLVQGLPLEQALTGTFQRYLRDLHQGRVDPQQVHENFRPARRLAYDPQQALNQAWASGQLEEAVQAAVPQLPMYPQLRETLASYRQLVGHTAWQTPLPPLPRRPTAKLSPGDTYAGLPLLSERLRALGDLAEQPAAVIGAGPPRYDGPLVDAVRAFQLRHGLGADGVVGSTTLAQLQVTPGQRVRQLELSLERLRWTPLMQAPRMVVVNIPEFVLRAYELNDGRITVKTQMKVIVGKALDTRTPLFDEDMRSIEFSPYWNVPPSIARSETVPRLRRDPGYLARMGFEFVSANGRGDTALTPEKLAAVLAGSLRIRQRPGRNNALGDIKFVFPNRDSIYLHHTPAVGLFERDRRDFSHGCIRVENPVALAKFVLQNMPEWTDERIAEAMSRGVSNTVQLTDTLPVLIVYGTAMVKQGRPYFFDDIYGLDRLLDNALRQRKTAPLPTPTPAAE